MSVFEMLRGAGWFDRLFGKRKHVRIGIYGPPNAGKTTLANRIVRDFAGDVMGAASPVPHETRRARKRDNVKVAVNGSSLTVDIVDTPGIATKIDFHEFVDTHGLTEGDARARAKEATEGVIESIRWLEDVDGVVLVMDSTEDPFTQVNVTLIGNIQSRRKRVVIAANKIDLPTSSPAALKAGYPQFPVVPISAMTGYNIDKLYETMIREFR